MSNVFFPTLVGQIRAIDTYGMWDKFSDEDLVRQRYIKTKEDLKQIPIIDDIKDETKQIIKMMYQAISLGFEKMTGEMANVIMEMSHEGFGRVCVICDKIVVCDKYLKDAHRFGFPTIEKLSEEGEKILAKAVETYKTYKKD